MIASLAIGLMLLAVGFGVLANTRWAGERGWVYNKHNPRPPGVGYVPGAFDQSFQPSVEHVIEARESERIRAEQDESGDGFHDTI